MKNSILVLSYLDDLETDFVLAKLNRKGILFTRIDLLRLGNHRFNITFKKEKREFPFNETDLEVVWNRVPFSLRGVVSSELPPEDNFSSEEKYWFLRNLGEQLTSIPWVNYPPAEEKANCKVSQLKEAQQIGFLIPDTLISNDLSKVSYFCSQYPRVVFKPIFHSGQISSVQESYLFTSIVKPEDLTKDTDLANSPGIFQEFIEKEYDLRVIVVKDHVFPIAIYSAKFKGGEIDWRRAKFSDLECKLIDIPEDIKQNCRDLTDKFGLVAVAIDMVVDKKGDYVFLELNPSGRWMQFELASGAPISDALVSTLSDPKNLKPPFYTLKL